MASAEQLEEFPIWAKMEVYFNKLELQRHQASAILLFLATATTFKPVDTNTFITAFNKTRLTGVGDVHTIVADSPPVKALNAFHRCAPPIVAAILEQQGIDLNYDAHSFATDSGMLYHVNLLWANTASAHDLRKAGDRCSAMLGQAYSLHPHRCRSRGNTEASTILGGMKTGG
ncbi:hypothetical protein BDK51DRAFT_26303 [Blyttiomyces helicus]|uniref:Uncharacterized protein n=1 Tax=Blyttiomyces helicus TaxID=388810 RepID=A0A4P9WF30_9FUNG|nr:hypothetical protein BDK51DRAFT_26303 [Blyttiomyces helicus]|eukprot:RKO91012.1 hypothetical protein BDK51DRAFT_26303 [Blyttiomyces helicus]